MDKSVHSHLREAPPYSDSSSDNLKSASFGAIVWPKGRRECYVDNHGKRRSPQNYRSDGTKRYMG